MSDAQTQRVRAVSMWDFSWLERRWPGAGFEDWGIALDELVERGYDCVRIDAYPHLVSADPRATWTLEPCWTTQDWGAPASVQVQVLPALVDFVTACKQRGVSVALSSWFRRDTTDRRMGLTAPERLAGAWVATLDELSAAGLLESILWVDLCNEFPLSLWAPFLWGGDEAVKSLPIGHSITQRWMTEALALVRERYPDLNYTFSFSGRIQDFMSADVQTLDILEPHIWMAALDGYYDRVGYGSQRFDMAGYEALVKNAKRVYLEDATALEESLMAEIDLAAEWSRQTGKPLATTECWSLIDYKDWPGLEWGWLMSVNERAVRRAASTGCWSAIATSNFCSPQFVGMWRDVDYHRRLTDLIHAAERPATDGMQ